MKGRHGIRKTLAFLAVLPIVLATPFGVWLVLPILRVIPWWGFLGICYFFASQGLAEFQDYQTRIMMTSGSLEEPRATRVKLRDFNASSDVAYLREILIEAVPLDPDASVEVKADKFLRYAIVPLSGAPGGKVLGVAIVSDYQSADLTRYLSGIASLSGQAIINGQFAPATPWLGTATIRRALEKRGHDLASDLVMIRPYFEGRLAVMQKEIRRAWFWVSIVGSLSIVTGVAGIWKLRRWLQRF